jgi:hypothetical protein
MATIPEIAKLRRFDFIRVLHLSFFKAAASSLYGPHCPIGNRDGNISAAAGRNLLPTSFEIAAGSEGELKKGNGGLVLFQFNISEGFLMIQVKEFRVVCSAPP